MPSSIVMAGGGRLHSFIGLNPEYSGPPEIFARAKSTKHFDQIKGLLAVTSKDEIVSVVERFDSGEIKAPKFGWHRLQLRDMLAIDDMCKLP